MSAFKKGDVVRQVMPAPVLGTVTGFSVDQETGAVLTLVEFKDAEGAVAETFFAPGQIEAA